MGDDLAPDPERGGLLPRWQASDAADPTDSPLLQAARMRLALAKLAHARLSRRIRLDYDVLELIADSFPRDRLPPRELPKAAQLARLRANDPTMTELNWFNCSCNDAEVAALVDALSPATATAAVVVEEGCPLEEPRRPNTALSRLWLHDNPRITDASAAGLLRVVATRGGSDASGLVTLELRGTGMSAENITEINRNVRERAAALWSEAYKKQEALSAAQAPARERDARALRRRERCDKRKRECCIGAYVAGVFALLKVAWLFAGWVGDWDVLAPRDATGT